MQIHENKKVIVAGAGAGGLASALLLQHAGFQVTVLEKNERPGGKLNREEINGFVFDTGPSILTLPGVVQALFAETGADVKDYMNIVPLDPQWRCWFNDGSHFDFRSGSEAMLEEVAQKFPDDVDGFRKLLARAAEMYKISEENFFFRDVSGVVDLIKAGELGGLDGLKLVMKIEPQTYYSTLVERYIKSPYLKQALEHLPQYVGSSPFLSPAILACLIHVQFAKGCWYPMGGMNKISEGIAKRFTELGGEVVLNAEITRINVKGDEIQNLETADGKKWSAGRYITNIDINTFNERMYRESRSGLATADGFAETEKIALKLTDQRDLACSGVTVFLGLKKRAQGLAHHNFFFSDNHRAEFADIYKKGVPHLDPTIYVCVPTTSDPSVAPAGKENVFLLIHAPAVNGKTAWPAYLDEYVGLVEAKLARLGFDFEKLGVEVRKSRSPQDIGEKWGTFRGNIYGVASHGKLAGGFKAGNQSRKFTNLHYAGGSVNPGAGVPMSLMSGMITAGSLIKGGEPYRNIKL